MDSGPVFLSIVPAWIAGRPLLELINIYMAQGAQDVWSLSIKWPNIYQIIGNQFFLLEYASSGTWLILGILMILMYAMARKRYRITNEFIVQMALFFAILTPISCLICMSGTAAWRTFSRLSTR